MRKDTKLLSKREGLILYWCEGDNPSTRAFKVAVTSGSYLIIFLFINWLIEYFNVSKNSVKLRLHIWPDTDEHTAKKYWSEKLGLPFENFTKSYIKSKSGVNKRYQYGICRASIDSKKVLLDILKSIELEFIGLAV